VLQTAQVGGDYLQGWLTAAAFVLVIATQITSIIRTFRRRPPIEAEYATKAEIKDQVKTCEHKREGLAGGQSKTREDITALREHTDERLAELASGISNRLDAFDQKSEERASALHSRVNHFVEQVSILKGTVDMVK